MIHLIGEPSYGVFLLGGGFRYASCCCQGLYPATCLPTGLLSFIRRPGKSRGPGFATPRKAYPRASFYLVPWGPYRSIRGFPRGVARGGHGGCDIPNVDGSESARRMRDAHPLLSGCLNFPAGRLGEGVVAYARVAFLLRPPRCADVSV